MEQTRVGRIGIRAGAVAVVTAMASFGLAVPAHAADPVTLNIMTVNDFHGRINSSTVQFGATIEKLRSEDGANGANSLLIGAGDFIGASEFVSASADDQPTIDVFNELGMVASAVGNHEFDQGWLDLRDDVLAGGTNAQWDYLGANVYDSASGEPVLPEYGIYEAGGVSVGIIGAVTEETSSLVSPDGIIGLTFGDPVEAINRVAAELTDGNPANGEADVLIATLHEGAPDGSQTLAQQVAVSPVFAEIVNGISPEVDAIVNGHTHQAYAYQAPVPGDPGRMRPVIETGSYAANVGQIQLTVDRDDDTVTSFTVKNVARLTTDVATLLTTYPQLQPLNAIVVDAIKNAAAIGNQPVGSLTADITTALPNPAAAVTSANRDDRSKPSTLGSLVADAVLDSLAPPSRGGAQFALVNPGGLRSDLLFAPDPANAADSAGTILYSEANAVLPFVNNLSSIDLTGAQVKTILEQQWQRDANGNIPTRPYLQLSSSKGFSYTFDPGLPEGSRITSMTLNGAPLDLSATYRVGTLTFLTAGGDNFRAFTQGKNLRDSGLVDRDAWIAYLGAHKPVSPDFANRSLSVTGLSPAAVAASPQTLSVSRIDLTSKGSPANTTLEATFARTADGAGAVPVGSAAVAAGAASIAVTFPLSAIGSGFLILTAQPTGTQAFIPVTVAAPPSTVTATAKTVEYGAAATIVVGVTAAGQTPAGTVTVADAEGNALGTATLENGTATVTLDRTALLPGTHTLTVSYGGSATAGAGTTAVDLTVTKASSATLALPQGPIVKKNATPKVLVLTRTSPQVPVTGPVTVSYNGTVVGTGTLEDGKARITLTPFTSKGVKLLTVSYGGSDTVEPSSARTALLVR